MLAAFGLAGGAAGVHQKQRIFGVHGNGFDDVVLVFLQKFVDKEIAAHDHGAFGYVFVRIAPPDEHFVHRLAFFFGGFDGDVGAGFVVYPAAIAVIAIGVNQNTAARIGGAHA